MARGLSCMTMLGANPNPLTQISKQAFAVEPVNVLLCRVSQMVRQFSCKEQIGGSSPAPGSKPKSSGVLLAVFCLGKGR